MAYGFRVLLVEGFIVVAALFLSGVGWLSNSKLCDLIDAKVMELENEARSRSRLIAVLPPVGTESVLPLRKLDLVFAVLTYLASDSNSPKSTF